MKYLAAALAGALALALFWGGYERGQHMGWRDYAKRLEIASRAQKALREQERQEYADKADDADKRYVAALDRVRAATVRHVRADRMLPSSGSGASSVGSTDPPEFLRHCPPIPPHLKETLPCSDGQSVQPTQ